MKSRKKGATGYWSRHWLGEGAKGPGAWDHVSVLVCINCVHEAGWLSESLGNYGNVSPPVEKQQLPQAL